MLDLNVRQRILKGASIDSITIENPHSDDPRYLNMMQERHCDLRYIVYCRCVRELGEDNPRCKYQYYRAQIICPLEKLDEYDEHRKIGACKHDIDYTRARYWARDFDGI
eukprot:Platyproteum_vivax@DN3587_c0_g1_i1.p1